MKIINLTPHAISIEANGERRLYPASGEVARVSSTSAHVGHVDGIPVSSTTYGAVQGIPEASPGVVYIVSGMVLAALQGSRSDVYAPDTGPTAIRDNGQIVAVRGLVQ